MNMRRSGRLLAVCQGISVEYVRSLNRSARNDVTVCATWKKAFLFEPFLPLYAAVCLFAGICQRLPVFVSLNPRYTREREKHHL